MCCGHPVFLEIWLCHIFHCCKSCPEGYFILTPRDGLRRSARRLWFWEKAVAAPSRMGGPGPITPAGCESSSSCVSRRPLQTQRDPPRPPPRLTLAPWGPPVRPAAPPLGPCRCLTRCFLTPLAAPAAVSPPAQCLTYSRHAGPSALHRGDLRLPVLQAHVLREFG